MQGDKLVFLNREDNSSQIFCHFRLSCRFFFFGLFVSLLIFFFFLASVRFLPIYLLSQGWQCTQCPQPLALTCVPPSEVLWF